MWSDIKALVPFQGPWDRCQRGEKVAWMYVESMTLAAKRLQAGGSCLITISEVMGSYSFNANSTGALYEAPNVPMVESAPRGCIKI